jgi:hypothetical protein
MVLSYSTGLGRNLWSGSGCAEMGMKAAMALCCWEKRENPARLHEKAKRRGARATATKWARPPTQRSAGLYCMLTHFMQEL